MKKEIKIQMPDNLSEEQEAIFISKNIIQKALSVSASSKSRPRIGNEITITEPETIIRVTRVSKEKPIEFCKCPVCSTEYQSNMATPYFTNYGGNIRKMATCSKECVSVMVAAFPGRTAATKSGLTPLRRF